MNRGSKLWRVVVICVVVGAVGGTAVALAAPRKGHYSGRTSQWSDPSVQHGDAPCAESGCDVSFKVSSGKSKKVGSFAVEGSFNCAAQAGSGQPDFQQPLAWSPVRSRVVVRHGRFSIHKHGITGQTVENGNFDVTGKFASKTKAKGTVTGSFDVKQGSDPHLAGRHCTLGPVRFTARWHK